MRWRFADQSNQEEMRFRREAIERFDSFWTSFELNLDLVKSPDLNKVAKFVSAAIKKVDPALMWELSPVPNGEHRFVITPECEYHLQPMVDTMIERAPEIPGFQISSHREPVVANDVKDGVSARTGQWYSDVLIVVLPSKRNSIDLNFYSKDFNGQNSSRDLGYCMVLCEVVLGQRIFEQWLGKIETHSTKPGLVAAVSSLFAKQAAKTPSDSVGIGDFKKVVEALRDTIVSNLPAEPLWQEHQEKAENSGGAILKWDENSSRRVTASTFLPDVILGVAPPPICFSSERFSRRGEIFCYLKIDESTAVVTNESPDRSEIEDRFSRALRKASVGCTTGGGWGPVYNFIDFALADVESAIPILRATAAELALPRASWLRFFDSTLSHEWIGIYPDTSEPDMSPGW